MSTSETLAEAAEHLQGALEIVHLATIVTGLENDDRLFGDDIAEDIKSVIENWRLRITESKKEDTPIPTDNSAIQILSDAFDAMQEVNHTLDPSLKPSLEFVLANLDALIKGMKTLQERKTL